MEYAIVFKSGAILRVLKPAADDIARKVSEQRVEPLHSNNWLTFRSDRGVFDSCFLLNEIAAVVPWNAVPKREWSVI